MEFESFKSRVDEVGEIKKKGQKMKAFERVRQGRREDAAEMSEGIDEVGTKRENKQVSAVVDKMTARQDESREKQAALARKQFMEQTDKSGAKSGAEGKAQRVWGESPADRARKIADGEASDPEDPEKIL